MYVPYYLCILCFWALYIAPTYMLDYIYRPLYLKYWALYRDHYSSHAFYYLGYICRPIFIMGFCSRRKHGNQSFGLYICSILFRYSQSFGLYIQSIFPGLFFLFWLWALYINHTALVSLGYICDPLPRFRGPRVLRRKNRRSPLGLRGW